MIKKGQESPNVKNEQEQEEEERVLWGFTDRQFSRFLPSRCFMPCLTKVQFSREERRQNLPRNPPSKGLVTASLSTFEQMNYTKKEMKTMTEA